jgi:hypothetical protein
MAKSLAATTANLEQISGRLNRGEGIGREAADRQGALRPVHERRESARSDRQRGGGRSGTAGKLLKDKELYDNLNQTVSEMQRADWRHQERSKKYLNVRVSIF